MGVPVVSLAGATAVSRSGRALLSAVGLPELAVATPARYLAAAVKLAGNPTRLAQLRRSLRQRMRSSALMDEQRFARDVEDAYQAMWSEWCARPKIRGTSALIENHEVDAI